VCGLLAELPRKNCWTLAEHAGDPLITRELPYTGTKGGGPVVLDERATAAAPSPFQGRARDQGRATRPPF
jgi:hypothetical protein